MVAGLANNALRVSELNFNTIKSSLKEYLKGKPEFTDYNFEDSTISTILDVLAYNTYHNSFYLNMIGNEMFLDTTTIRESAVSRAKELNYLPRSAKSSEVSAMVQLSPVDTPSEIIVPKYTKFYTTIDGVKYEFTTDENYVIPNDDGIYRKALTLYEGFVETYTFTYDGTVKFFEMPNDGLDTNSVKVYVRENSSTTTQTLYTLATDLTEIDSSSTVFFLQENINGFYEIYFGDGVLGKALQNGNVITITCRFCNGTRGNSITNLTNVGYVGYNVSNTSSQYIPSSITLQTPTRYGQEREALAGIKFNAPKNYEMQNRTVIEKDYEALIKSKYSYVSAISVWGGEKHDPPVYGKVLISIKPTNGYALSQNKKDLIETEIKKYNVMSIDPVFVDPIFIFIKPTIEVKYNPSLTTLSAAELHQKVAATILNFESENLGSFERTFRYSKFLKEIDNTDPAIVGVFADIVLEKRFAPILNSKISYKLRFDTRLNNPFIGYQGTLSSTGFKVSISDQICYFDDNGQGKIRIYYLNAQNEKIYIDKNAGTINYVTGDVTFDAMYFTYISGDEIRVFVEVEDYDYTATKNQIILMSYPLVNMYNIQFKLITNTGTVDSQGNVSPLTSKAINIPVVF